METKTKILTWIGLPVLLASILFLFTQFDNSIRGILKIESFSEKPRKDEARPDKPKENRVEELEKRRIERERKRIELERQTAERQQIRELEEAEKLRAELDKLEQLMAEQKQQVDPSSPAFSLGDELARLKAEKRSRTLPKLNPFFLIDSILESLPLGAIAFNAPSSMNLNDLAQIQLLLSMEKSIEELSNMVTAAGEKEGTRIRVSNRMDARLSGAGFQITAVTPEEQAIASKSNTEWKWEVTPKSPGQQHLHLTLAAIFNVDNTSMRRAIRTYDKTIEVEVTWRQRVSGFIGKNWQWLWATLLIPIAGFLWKICKRGLSTKRETPQKSDKEQ